MSKVIAVWGTPDSGKTTFAVKLANAIYEKYVSTVLVVSTDIETPSLPILCPHTKEELHSLGEALSKPEIRREDILSCIVTIKGRDNYGLAGFIGCDNRNRYPEYMPDKADELLAVMKTVADIIIIDCMSPLHDVFSDTAVRRADKVFRIAAPTMKSLSFLSSQLPLYIDSEYKTKDHIVVLNNPIREVDLPVEEMKAQLGNVGYTIPFNRGISEQFATGMLTDASKDKKLRTLFLEIATAFIKEESTQ